MHNLFASFEHMGLNGLSVCLELPRKAEMVKTTGDSQVPTLWMPGGRVHYFASKDVANQVLSDTQSASVSVRLMTEELIQIAVATRASDDLWRTGRFKDSYLLAIVEGTEDETQLAWDHYSPPFGGMERRGRGCFARSIIGSLPVWCASKPSKEMMMKRELAAMIWLQQHLCTLRGLPAKGQLRRAVSEHAHQLSGVLPQAAPAHSLETFLRHQQWYNDLSPGVRRLYRTATAVAVRYWEEAAKADGFEIQGPPAWRVRYFWKSIFGSVQIPLEFTRDEQINSAHTAVCLSGDDGKRLLERLYPGLVPA